MNPATQVAHGLLRSVAAIVPLAAVLFLLAGCSTPRPTASAALPPRSVSLHEILDKAAQKTFAANVSDCFVIGVVTPYRTAVKGYGLCPGPNYELLAPDADSVFQIASLTKLFTAVVLQSLVDEGRLSLDDTLGELIGRPWVLSERAARITLRQLATHTSGLPRLPQPIQARMRYGDDPYRSLRKSHIYRYLRDPVGLGSPGRYLYSNYGTGLLGHALEDVTRKPLEALMQERIFQPLAMRSTSANTMRLRRPPVQGRAAAGHLARPWRFGALEGAGALYSTARDMTRFMEAHLWRGRPLQGSLGRTRAGENASGIGLGWLSPALLGRGHEKAIRNLIWHNGEVGGYASYIVIDEAERIGAVVLSGRARDVTLPGLEVLRAVRILRQGHV